MNEKVNAERIKREADAKAAQEAAEKESAAAKAAVEAAAAEALAAKEALTKANEELAAVKAEREKAEKEAARIREERIKFEAETKAEAERLEAEKKAAEEKKAIAAKEAEEKRKAEEAALAAMEPDLEPVELMTGVLKPLKNGGNSAATHALCQMRNQGYVIVCYVIAPQMNLTPWNNYEVTIEGEKIQHKGWRYPVIKVRSIMRKRQ